MRARRNRRGRREQFLRVGCTWVRVGTGRRQAQDEVRIEDVDVENYAEARTHQHPPVISSPDTWDKIPGINPVEYRTRSRLLLAVGHQLRDLTDRKARARLGISAKLLSALRMSDIAAFDAATLTVFARRLGIEEITTV